MALSNAQLLMLDNLIYRRAIEAEEAARRAREEEERKHIEAIRAA